MTLYDMLDKSVYYQQVWIYRTNDCDQNMPIFKGIVENARRDEEIWDYLKDYVDLYKIINGILVIYVSNDAYYERRIEEFYSGSKSWGIEENQRPWKYSIEVEREALREKMTVIEFAEKRMAEEEKESERGADNGYLLRYWAAYLDGAKAQRDEMLENDK